jgi:hypothetical protein
MAARLLVFLSAFLWPFHLLPASTNMIDPEQLAYNLKTTVAAYERVGRKSPKWDADAKRCLTAFARIRSSTNTDISEFRDELRTILPRLVTAKCDDPMIRYLYLRNVFADSHSAGETAAAFGEVAAAMQLSAYPDIRKFYTMMWARRTLQNAEPQRPEIATLLEKAAAFLAKALNDNSMPVREADESCDFLMSAPWWAEAARWDCYRVLEPVLTNRWKGTSVALLTKGRAYLSYSWQARGKGYANTVTEKGWQSLAERLEIAAEALEAAWKLNPRDVRICREMMRIELGQGKGSDRLETWFQRGMKLDPANYDLCAEKLEYLRPRWYGSSKAMIDFGRECTANTNWAGTVRVMLADAHYEASREIQDDEQRAAYWKQTNVWSDIQFTFEQFLKLYPEEVGYRHNYARYAARCGEWQKFMNQIKLFPSTNHAYFGGVERFNSIVQFADEQLKKQ